MDIVKQSERLFALAIHDNHGRLWCPLFGYAGEVVAYAPGKEAIETFNRTVRERVDG